MAVEVNSLEILIKFSDCILEAVKYDSEFFDLTDSTKQFIDENRDIIKRVDSEFNTEMWMQLNHYLANKFNDFTNDLIEDEKNPAENFVQSSLDDYLKLIQIELNKESKEGLEEQIPLPNCFQIVKEIISQRLQSLHDMSLLINKISSENMESFRMQIRLSEIKNKQNILELSKQAEQAEKTIDKKIKDSSNYFDRRLKEKETEFDSKIIETKHNAEKESIKSSVTILGVFSAVVMTFNAAISFYSATAQQISDANIYKILVILLVVGLIVINVFIGLFSYLERIRLNGEKKRSNSVGLLIVSNILIISLIITVFVAWGKNVDYREEIISSSSDSEPETDDLDIEFPDLGI